MEKTQLQNYHVHYGPAQGWSRVDLRELWRYKDLIWLFVKRDFNVMYKQTVLGPAWILINPLMSTAMYCVMFGTIAQLSTDGVPQILFYLAGTALWGFFSSCINKVSGTFTTNSNILCSLHCFSSCCLSTLPKARSARTGACCCCACRWCCRSACWALAAASSCPA